MQITLLFFARARDLAGGDRFTLELPAGASVAELRTVVLDRFPGLAGQTGPLLVAVNQAYATDDTVVPDHAEVAIFPPVSGG